MGNGWSAPRRSRAAATRISPVPPTSPPNLKTSRGARCRRSAWPSCAMPCSGWKSYATPRRLRRCFRPSSVAAAHAAAALRTRAAALGRAGASGVAAGAHLEVADLRDLVAVPAAVVVATAHFLEHRLLAIGLDHAEIARLGDRHALQIGGVAGGAGGDHEQRAKQDSAHRVLPRGWVG